jgi:hypothetical protein
MAKKKRASAPIGAAPAKRLPPPDTSVLAQYSPTDPSSHPDWIKQGFSGYIDPHAGHETTAIREFTHAGHVVRIVTTYRVEVDGRQIRAHLSVDEDGRVYTHATPFVTYASAVDLMKQVIDSYRDDFSDNGGHSHDHGH